MLVKSIRTGYCTCNDPIISIAGDFFMKSVIEAGKILIKVMCPTLQALDIVVEIGSAAIPGVGKAITVGMSKLSSYLDKIWLADGHRDRHQDCKDVQVCLRRPRSCYGVGKHGKLWSLQQCPT